MFLILKKINLKNHFSPIFSVFIEKFKMFKCINLQYLCKNSRFKGSIYLILIYKSYKSINSNDT